MSARSPLRFIPNLLTVLRLVLAAAFPFVDARTQVPVLVVALATEWLDGVLARGLGWESRFGRMLDPVADRALFGSVIVTFLVEQRLTPAQLGLLGARDVFVAAGTLWLVLGGHGRVLRRMAPRPAGKITTALQYVALLCVAFGYAVPWLLAAVTCALGLFAAAQYLADARRLRNA